MAELTEEDKKRADALSVVSALRAGGSVVIADEEGNNRKTISKIEDLPDDHPARALAAEAEQAAEKDNASGADGQPSAAEGQAMLSRIAELESHLNAAYANLDASEKSRKQAEDALEATKAERDDMAKQLEAAKADAAASKAAKSSPASDKGQGA